MGFSHNDLNRDCIDWRMTGKMSESRIRWMTRMARMFEERMARMFEDMRKAETLWNHEICLICVQTIMSLSDGIEVR